MNTNTPSYNSAAGRPCCKSRNLLPDARPENLYGMMNLLKSMAPAIPAKESTESAESLLSDELSFYLAISG